MWHYQKHDRSWGPLPPSVIRNLLDRKVLSGDTLVRREGMAEWMPLRQSAVMSETDATVDREDSIEQCAWSAEHLARSNMIQLEGFWVAAAHKDAVVQYLKQGGQLPRVEMHTRTRGSLRFSHLLRETWKALAAVIAPALAVLIPVLVLKSLVMYQFGVWIGQEILATHPWSPSTHAHSMLLLRLGSLVSSGLFGSLVLGSIYELLTVHAARKRATLSQAVAGAFRHWLPLVAVFVTKTLGFLLGFLLFVVPGIFIAVRLSLAGVALVDQRARIGDALVLSWDLTSGYFWATAWRLGTLLAVVHALHYALGRLSAMAIEMNTEFPLYLAPDALRGLPVAFYAAFEFVYFRELMTRKSLA